MQNQEINFAVIADVQYSDEDNLELCHFRQSPEKLYDAVSDINQSDAQFTVQLGDFINQYEKSYEIVLPIWDELLKPSRHVLGNHDLMVSDQFKQKVAPLLGLQKTWYSEIVNDWRFIYLDGNDISFSASCEGTAEYEEVEKYYQAHGAPSPRWNGALGEEQLQWLENELQIATRSEQKVMIFCHFAVYPFSEFCLWNAPYIVSIIDKYTCVKAWFNGHEHDGNYQQRNHCHYLSFKGMVDTDESSFAFVSLKAESIEITGMGREISRSLAIAEPIPDELLTSPFVKPKTARKPPKFLV